MPKVSSNASDKQNDAMTSTSNVISSLAITTDPIVITAVQRKVNIGNFETIDLYMAVVVPQPELDVLDKDALVAGITKAAELGFNIASKGTGDRYLAVKESLKNR